tara:strand:- start:1440 stop:1625 length:186 start_codon:yes stop_codon:yes gene_type:complete
LTAGEFGSSPLGDACSGVSTHGSPTGASGVSPYGPGGSSSSLDVSESFDPDLLGSIREPGP